MIESCHPKSAATVILARPDLHGAFEVFITRRPRGMNFLGGMYVFPGGTVRKEDYSESTLRLCLGLAREEAQQMLGMQLSPELSLGHWTAGIRELFEETGILLCVDKSGKPPDTGEEQLKGRLAGKRKALVEGSMDFREILKSEQLFSHGAALAYFSHWLTPEEFSMRFDTRFFVAQLPPDQSPLASSEEVTESRWIKPERAVDLCERGELPMIFPTFASLRTLADFDSLESLFEEYGLGAKKRSPLAVELQHGSRDGSVKATLDSQ